MVCLMETLARWVPSAPEMEAKVLLGQHIWDVARHADALGHRVHELRSPLHHSLPPSPGYQQILEKLAATEATADRIHGLYEVVLPGLVRRYEEYIGGTDLLLDAPSVRVIETIVREIERMRTESARLLQELPRLQEYDVAWQASLAAADAARPGLVQFGGASEGQSA
jgi:hypothetical protein